MSELILIKTTEHPDIHNGGLPLEAVVGVSVANAKTTIEHGYHTTGHETEETLNGANDVIEAIASFFRETQAKRPEDRSSYNCHSFIAYSFGWQLTPQHTDASGFNLLSDEVPPTQLWPATPYALIDRGGQHNHSTLGINRPEYSMGILGTNNPFVICTNGLLRYLYSTEHIKEVSGISHQEPSD